MDEPLYVRIRGRVQGPVNEEKLRSLVKRGQLARLHEVSADGTNWQRASDFPKIFDFPVENPVSSGGDNEPEAPDPDPVPPDTSQWSRMIVEPPIENTPLTNEIAEVQRDLQRTLVDSRPWVMFIAITGFIYAVALVALGLLLIIEGARADQFTGIAIGLTCFLYAGVIGTGSMYLIFYQSRLGKLLQSSDQLLLDAAMRILRTFWVFVGIVLIVFLVNTVGVAIWVFSMMSTSTLPNFSDASTSGLTETTDTQNELLEGQVDRQATEDVAGAKRQKRLAFIDEKVEYAASAVNKLLMSVERTSNAAEREFKEITEEKTIGQIGQDDGPSYYTELSNELRSLLIKKTMHIEDYKKFEDAVSDETENWMKLKGGMAVR